MILLLPFLLLLAPDDQVRLPIRSNTVTLTSIGEFGLTRKARTTVPEHLHTGIDIKRPTKNYANEPILSIANGVVISKREDGPYAQLIIEHKSDKIYWTVYEHIAGVTVNLNEKVDSGQVLARFMNRKELDKYGWQFDHFHFEVIKVQPQKVSPTKNTPVRHFKSYTLTCFSKKELLTYFYNPITFLHR